MLISFAVNICLVLSISPHCSLFGNPSTPWNFLLGFFSFSEEHHPVILFLRVSWKQTQFLFFWKCLYFSIILDWWFHYIYNTILTIISVSILKMSSNFHSCSWVNYHFCRLHCFSTAFKISSCVQTSTIPL